MTYTIGAGSKEKTMEIHGHCDERFAALREEFERNFAERGDVGASFAATIEGEYVIDIWTGHRDGAKTLPWEQDTIVCVYSTTKTMTALSALLLFDRGELSFDDPVMKYWPEDVKMSFWGGMGGSTIILDHTNRVCMSYVMNQMDLSLLGAERT